MLWVYLWRELPSLMLPCFCFCYLFVTASFLMFRIWYNAGVNVKYSVLLIKWSLNKPTHLPQLPWDSSLISALYWKRLVLLHFANWFHHWLLNIIYLQHGFLVKMSFLLWIGIIICCTKLTKLVVWDFVLP